MAESLFARREVGRKLLQPLLHIGCRASCHVGLEAGGHGWVGSTVPAASPRHGTSPNPTAHGVVLLIDCGSLKHQASDHFTFHRLDARGEHNHTADTRFVIPKDRKASICERPFNEQTPICQLFFSSSTEVRYGLT